MPPRLSKIGISSGIAHLDAVQNRRIEHVNPRVNPVTNKFYGFLNESVDHRRVRLGDNNTVG